MAEKVDELAKVTPGKKALAIESFARALRSIPKILADNGGYDSAELVSQLRAAQVHGAANAGLNMSNGSIGDMEQLGVTESYKSKNQSLTSATGDIPLHLRLRYLALAAHSPARGRRNDSPMRRSHPRCPAPGPCVSVPRAQFSRHQLADVFVVVASAHALCSVARLIRIEVRQWRQQKRRGGRALYGQRLLVLVCACVMCSSEILSTFDSNIYSGNFAVCHLHRVPRSLVCMLSPSPSAPALPPVVK